MSSTNSYRHVEGREKDRGLKISVSIYVDAPTDEFQPAERALMADQLADQVMQAIRGAPYCNIPLCKIKTRNIR